MSFFFNRSNKYVGHTNSYNQHFDSNNSYAGHTNSYGQHYDRNNSYSGFTNSYGEYYDSNNTYYHFDAHGHLATTMVNQTPSRKPITNSELTIYAAYRYR